MRKAILLPSFAVIALPNVALAQHEPKLNLDLDGTSMAFVRINPGRFTMGSPASETGRNDDETQHPVVLRDGYYMATTPVTVGQWKRFVAATGYRTEAEKGSSGGSGWDGQALVQKPSFTWQNPGFVQGEDHPVTLVTYDDALAFAQWATQKTSRYITLPTEAQWEYAYRAGTTTSFYDPKAKDALGLGWFKNNAGKGTKPVAQKPANPWGLHDMAGNVWQWCLDWYAPYTSGELTDPLQSTPDTSDKARRVLRGGSWLKDPRNGRAAARFRNTPATRNADNGFRLVLLDQSPPVISTPTTPPATNDNQPKTTPQRTSEPPESSSSSSFWKYIVGIPFIYVFVRILSGIFRGKNSGNSNQGGSSGSSYSKWSSSGSSGSVNIRLEPARDGYWIHAMPSEVGKRITVRYYVDGMERLSHATIETATGGQFVYTGHQPFTPTVINEENTNSSWNSNHSSSVSSWDSNRNDDSSSSSSFRGYPSAY